MGKGRRPSVKIKIPVVAPAAGVTVLVVANNAEFADHGGCDTLLDTRRFIA